MRAGLLSVGAANVPAEPGKGASQQEILAYGDRLLRASEAHFGRASDAPGSSSAPPSFPAVPGGGVRVLSSNGAPPTPAAGRSKGTATPADFSPPQLPTTPNGAQPEENKFSQPKPPSVPNPSEDELKRQRSASAF